MHCGYGVPDLSVDALVLALLYQPLIDSLFEFLESDADIPADRIRPFRELLKDGLIAGRTMSYEKLWIRDRRISEAARAKVLRLLEELDLPKQKSEKRRAANLLLDILGKWQRGFLWDSQTLEHIPPPAELSKLCT